MTTHPHTQQNSTDEDEQPDTFEPIGLAARRLLEMLAQAHLMDGFSFAAFLEKRDAEIDDENDGEK